MAGVFPSKISKKAVSKLAPQCFGLSSSPKTVPVSPVKCWQLGWTHKTIGWPTVRAWRIHMMKRYTHNFPRHSSAANLWLPFECLSRIVGSPEANTSTKSTSLQHTKGITADLKIMRYKLPWIGPWNSSQNIKNIHVYPSTRAKFFDKKTGGL